MARRRLRLIERPAPLAADRLAAFAAGVSFCAFCVSAALWALPASTDASRCPRCSAYFDACVPAFRLTAMPIVWLWCWAGVTRACGAHYINYRFIMEVSLREEAGWHWNAAMAATLTAAWLVIFALFTASTRHGVDPMAAWTVGAPLAPAYYPLGLVVFCALVIVFPPASIRRRLVGGRRGSERVAPPGGFRLASRSPPPRDAQVVRASLQPARARVAGALHRARGDGALRPAGSFPGHLVMDAVCRSSGAWWTSRPPPGFSSRGSTSATASAVRGPRRNLGRDHRGAVLVSPSAVRAAFLRRQAREPRAGGARRQRGEIPRLAPGHRPRERVRLLGDFPETRRLLRAPGSGDVDRRPVHRDAVLVRVGHRHGLGLVGGALRVRPRGRVGAGGSSARSSTGAFPASVGRRRGTACSARGPSTRGRWSATSSGGSRGR